MSLPKLFWRKKEGAREITFSGAPFSVDKDVVFDCQYGTRYWKEKRRKNVRLQIQTSRKLGCHAHIKVKCYTVYSDFKIDESVGTVMSSRQMRSHKESVLKELREAILNGKANGCAQHFVLLPTEAAHCGHPTGTTAGFSQRLHPIVIAKVKELVASGVTDTHEVKKILKYYVRNDVAREHEITPSATDRAFYPMSCDIKNHIGLAKCALELSRLDQENLRLKVAGWKKSSPSSSHYFRPYIERDEIDHEKPVKSSIKPGHFSGLTGDYQENELQDSSNSCSQTLLWVHQEEWQRNLLVKFGNIITLIDATYKTTKYEVPLFFLSVKTNVNYVVVAEFIIQSETADEISEALSVLKKWNPTWDPAFFMSDYSEAESLAIENVFPKTTLYLCDFIESKLGNVGRRITSMVLQGKKENVCWNCFVIVLMHQHQMKVNLLTIIF